MGNEGTGSRTATTGRTAEAANVVGALASCGLSSADGTETQSSCEGQEASVTLLIAGGQSSGK